MAYTVVIPARYGSTRLPGKPLLDIAGKPMVQRVWEQARRSAAREVVIATDDERIMAVAEGFGAKVCMTSPDHPSGTDRLHEVAAYFGWGDEQIVVNVQGDEPMIPPGVIDQVARNLATHTRAGIATLCEGIVDIAELLDPNAVKVVCDSSGRALYFSRAPIPFHRDDPDGFGGTLHHVGLYAYRRATLLRFAALAPTPLEQTEKLEQLRALENGIGIGVVVIDDRPPLEVDTPADLERARAAVLAESAASSS